MRDETSRAGSAAGGTALYDANAAADFVRLAARIVGGGALLFLLLLPLMAPEQPWRALGAALAAGLALCAVLLLRRGRAGASVRVMVFGCWGIISLTALLFGGLDTPVVVGYPIVIMVAGWLIGPRSAWRLAGLTLVYGLVLVLAQETGHLPPALSPPLMIWAEHAIVLLVAVALMHDVVARYDSGLRESRRLGAQLAVQLDTVAQREAELKHQHMLYQALLDAQSEAGVGLFIIEAGRVVFANEAVCRLSGYTQDELRALPSFLDLAHPKDQERIRLNHMRRLAGEHFENRYDVAMVTKAGERRQVEISVATMPGDGGTRVLVIVVDVTDRRATQQALRRLNAELESRVRSRTAELTNANKELESFAYTMSHDLRSPLRAIDGFAQMLYEEYGDRLDDAGLNYLERVRKAAQRMGALIDDILELTRVTRHAMKLERVDLSRLAHEVVDELSRGEPARKVDVSIEPGCAARGDPRLLRVLLQNLLDNAWKYTRLNPDAHIEFGYAGPGVFCVRDNGVGFDAQYADRMFMPFQRLHTSGDFEGSGIGLASAARVVQRHGGQVWAEGRPGEGASFYFALPEDRAGATIPPMEASAA